MRHPIPEHQCPQCGYSTVVTINSDGTKVPSRIAALAAELREAKQECDERHIEMDNLQISSGIELLELRTECATLRATVAELRAKEPQ